MSESEQQQQQPPLSVNPSASSVSSDFNETDGDGDTTTTAAAGRAAAAAAAAAGSTATTTTTTAHIKIRPLHVVFVHLDLGIGGAEQLVTQLAMASLELGHKVELVTTRCDPNHCFGQYKPPNGQLYNSLHVYGKWIPADIFGYLRTFMSTLRLMYLAVRVAFTRRSKTKSPDVYVVDVLPTPLLVLNNLTDAATLFYCHFPDKLLKRDAGRPGKTGKLTQLYRSIMNNIEGWTMNFADTIVVNSLFTRRTVLRSFPCLAQQKQTLDDENDEGAEEELPVLYPALDGSSLDEYRTTRNKVGDVAAAASKDADETTTIIQKEYMIVSLNRYERKKNLELFLEAAAWVREHHPTIKLPRLVVAGGYDVQNQENVDYLQELKQLASKLSLEDNVEFKCSISDTERSKLLYTALAVIYTPSNEHFGIVPLEAMYASTPVIAVNNGGPTESIINETTGYLCESSLSEFGTAILKLLNDYPNKSIRMGNVGRQHVITKFGELRLKKEWKILTEKTLIKGRRRLANSRFHVYRLARIIFYIIEALWTLAIALLGTWLVHQLLLALGILDKESLSIWDYVRKMVVARSSSSSESATPTTTSGGGGGDNEL